MTRRGRENVAFSLFSFQDIITSVTGIMILITLILALELIQLKDSSPAQRTRELASELEGAVTDAEELQRAVLQSQARIEELRQQLSQGDVRLREMAAFDPRRLAEEVADLERVNAQLESELVEVEKRRRKAEHQKEQTEQLREQLAQQPQTVEQMLQAIQEKREALAELKASNRVIYNRAPGETKTPWLVEINGAGLIAAKVGEARPPQTFPNVAAFAAWVAQRDLAREYFVLLVKPAGIDNYAAARQVLQQARFDVGYDVLAADQQAIHPEKGAAAE